MADMLSGRVAWVTGGAGGIGTGIVRQLQRAGAAVGVLDLALPDPPDDEFADTTYVTCDVSREKSLSLAANDLDELLGPPDILVHCAATVTKKALMDMTQAEWDRQIDVNLSSAFRLAQRALPGMLDRGWGRIVSIASGAAVRPWHGGTAYAASKAGLVAFTKALALEVGAFGVTANCVAPGFVDTTMSRGAVPEGAFDELRAALGTNPLNVELTGDDIGNAVTFFCLPASRGITGQTLHVNAGTVMP